MADTSGLRRSTRSRKLVCYSEHGGTTETPRVTIKTEVTLSSAIDPNVSDTVYTYTLPPPVIKSEPTKDDDLMAPQARKPAKKKAIKREAFDDEDSENDRPVRKKATKKKTKEPELPHRLVIVAGMIRPPGERRPPMIYPVIKGGPKPKHHAAVFHFDDQRAKSRIKPLQTGEEEKRIWQYVGEPPDYYLDRSDRAATQRMYVLQRERGFEEDCHAHHSDCPFEYIQLAGSSGNVYQVRISHKPTCSCPDHIMRRHRTCKHILYVLHHVLKAEGYLKYQNAFLTDELRQIFKAAPPLVQEIKQEKDDGKRKPLEDDCPICCMPFEENEKTVWCESSCGNNLHTSCFDQWARVNPHNVRCPFCRAAWESTAKQTVKVADVTMPTMRDQHGYLNVADQLDYA